MIKQLDECNLRGALVREVLIDSTMCIARVGRGQGRGVVRDRMFCGKMGGCGEGPGSGGW